MKNIFRTILCLSVFMFMTKAIAANEITIPLQFLNDVANTSQFKLGKNFFQNLLTRQIINNTVINGVSLKGFGEENLADYFNADKIFQKTGTNRLVEPMTGAVLEFTSDGSCKNDECYITVDFNGDKGPNELWISADNPKDRMKFIIKRLSDDNISIVLPEFTEPKENNTP